MDPKALSCIICKTDLITSGQSQNQTSAIVCGHVFHSKCLEAWLRRNPSCPNCRHPVHDENDIIDKLYFDEDTPDGGESSTSQKEGDQAMGFGGGMVVGAVLTALAVGIGYLFSSSSSSSNKRKK